VHHRSWLEAGTMGSLRPFGGYRLVAGAAALVWFAVR
jgi:hypothetical protein